MRQAGVIFVLAACVMAGRFSTWVIPEMPGWDQPVNAQGDGSDSGGEKTRADRDPDSQTRQPGSALGVDGQGAHDQARPQAPQQVQSKDAGRSAGIRPHHEWT